MGNLFKQNFFVGLQGIGLDPAKGSFFITDTSGDVREGKEAGIKTIATTWGYHTKEELVEAKPDYIVDDVQQLEVLLVNENSGSETV